MGLVLQLVETGAESRTRSVDVIEISRPGDLRDIADLGLTLSEAKQLLARVQQAVVAAQAHDHAALRPACSSCGGRCHVKDWRSRRVATLFGKVAVRLPRLLCPGCGRSETGTSWPSHCRSTPELDRLQAHLSALMTYRVAAGVLAHLLPVAAGTSHETHRIAQRLPLHAGQPRGFGPGHALQRVRHRIHPRRRSTVRLAPRQMSQHCASRRGLASTTCWRTCDTSVRPCGTI